MTSQSPSKHEFLIVQIYWGDDTIVPDILDKVKVDSVVENESPRGGKNNLRPNHSPNFMMNTDTSQEK